MCPVWLLVAVVIVGGAEGAVGQCWKHPSCQELDSESSMTECLQLCRSDLTAETPLIPDPFSFISPSPQTKRSYSMEHFRWGKPVGRKRRPVKVYAPNGVEEESSEVFPGEMRRRELANEAEEAMEEVEEERQHLLAGLQEKKDGSYKMKHFRWGGPPASKRYGGFMKSWEEERQKPLVTLFKNIINKDDEEETVQTETGEDG
uniref:Proopiomelanocortin n=1 Tax=Oryzias melastigma TaxID=30732 RepID=A0A3B3CD68_ORYME